MATISNRTTSAGQTTYQVKVRKRGTSVSSTLNRKADAPRWAAETEAAILNGTYSIGTGIPTLGDAIDRYRSEIVPGLSPEEQRKRPAQLDLWRKKLGSKTLTDINAADVARIRDRWKSDGSSPATVNRRLAALAALYTAAVKQWHIIPASAHVGRKVARLEESNGIVRFLDEKERGALLEATAASDNAFLHVAVILSLATGWRQSEIMGLTWDRVDTVRGRLTLETTKNGDRRGVGVSGYTLQVLRKFAKVRRLDTDLLFPSRVDATKPMTLRKPWERALRKSGIENFRWRDLRHTTATYLAMNGASLPEIGAVLGHRTQRMTQRYAHLSDDHLGSVLEDMTSKVLG